MLPPSTISVFAAAVEHVLIRRRCPIWRGVDVRLGQHTDEQSNLSVENGLGVAECVGAVLPEHPEADRAHDAGPHRETLDNDVIVAGKAELLAKPFKV